MTTLNVSSGVTLFDVTLSAGDQIHILSSGRTVSTAVRSGGEEIVFDGGSSSRTVISSGGVEIVSSGGVAVTAKVLQGGKVIVAAGGAIAVGLNINGGVAVIRGAAITGQAVKFMGTSGTLEIDSVSEFRTKISGFDAPNEHIVLGGFAFSSGETVTWTQLPDPIGFGTLTVHDGAKTAHLTLIGHYATSDFQLASGPVGGTVITDRSSPAAARFAQTIAELPGGRSQGGYAAAVHACGTEQPLAPRFAGAATSGR